MRNTALAIRDVDYGSGVGTDMFISFARKGMMRAAAETYASTLPEGLGTVFSSRMTQLVDKNTTASMQQWKNLAYCNGQISIENHARCIERSNQMLTLLNNAVELLRTRHKNGESYYWILYYAFLSPQQLESVNEIMEQLQPHIRDISRPTYYRKREQAVEALSSILWGYTSKDCMALLEDFFSTLEA